jgi:hypothetical protein
MQSTSDELAQKTLAFWHISKVFYQGTGVPMSMSQALERCGDASETLNPVRPLFARFESLQVRLIQGRQKRRSTSKSKDVIVKLKLNLPIACGTSSG